MKDRLYFYFAIVTHPILIVPFFMILMTLEFNFKIEGILLVCGLILPLIVLSLLKIDFRDPNLADRRKIYAIVALGYSLYILLAYLDYVPYYHFFRYWAPIWAGLMLLMVFINYRFKISWHALAWGHVLSLTGLFVGVTQYEDMVILPAFFSLAIVILLSFLVMRVRYLQKAHTARELIIGFALGLFLSNLSILLYDIL